MSKVMLTDTILRDAHQSQAATRMTLDEMLPVLDQLDDIGYYSLEAWGGATFDSCMRFLNEDPWERLRILKSHLNILAFLGAWWHGDGRNDFRRDR